MELLMSRKKDRTLWQHRFNLSSDDPEQQRLHDFLSKLADDDRASEWVIESLIAQMLLEQNAASKSPGVRTAYLRPPKPAPTPKFEFEDDEDEDVTYEDLDE